MKAISEAQGYEFIAVEAEPTIRHPTWLKIAPIREAIEKSFDWVLWVDADALFLRVDRDIRDEIRGNVDIRMAWHVPLKEVTDDPPHFNNGVMLIRCCDWARRFFAQVWDTGPVSDHWDEQATIMHLLGYDDVLGLGPRKVGAFDAARLGLLNIAWNAIPGVTACDDPIVHHYAGIEQLETRLRIIRIDAGIPVECRKSRSSFHCVANAARLATTARADRQSMAARLVRWSF
jgi:hypothetical protein